MVLDPSPPPLSLGLYAHLLSIGCHGIWFHIRVLNSHSSAEFEKTSAERRQKDDQKSYDNVCVCVYVCVCVHKVVKFSTRMGNKCLRECWLSSKRWSQIICQCVEFLWHFLRLEGYLMRNAIQIQQNDSKFYTLNITKSSESVVEKTKKSSGCVQVCVCVCKCMCVCVCVCVVCVLERETERERERESACVGVCVCAHKVVKSVVKKNHHQHHLIMYTCFLTNHLI